MFLIIPAFVLLCLWIGSYKDGCEIMAGKQIPMEEDRKRGHQ